MLPLGFRFGEDAIVLDGTAHRTDCSLLPVQLPRRAVRVSAGEVFRARGALRGVSVRHRSRRSSATSLGP
ncbi:MAG: hypothetical protein DLM62_09005 [Pseudonocardiales bacterium]|nr:MAG: hypothetical protein DLM62_09005 [Pseudonocardiales bacterium]